MSKKLDLNKAYSLKTPNDSVKLYKKWAQTYDADFALNSNYQSPKIISNFYNKYANNLRIDKKTIKKDILKQFKNKKKKI